MTEQANTYTLELNVCDDIWHERFAFNADSHRDAEDKAFRRGRYHGNSSRDIRVRLATEQEAMHWMHNEYIEMTDHC